VRILAENIDFFRSLPLARVKEVMRFLERVDNRELLKRLRNRTLIFGGQNDGLMPVALAQEMNGLIKDSRLVMTEGGHFDTVHDDYLGEIGKFLGVK